MMEIFFIKPDNTKSNTRVLQSFTERDLGTGVDEKKERERAISLGLRGKPIKPVHRTHTTREGTGCPLKEVLKARARK